MRVPCAAFCCEYWAVCQTKLRMMAPAMGAWVLLCISTTSTLAPHSLWFSSALFPVARYCFPLMSRVYKRPSGSQQASQSQKSQQASQSQESQALASWQASQPGTTQQAQESQQRGTTTTGSSSSTADPDSGGGSSSANSGGGPSTGSASNPSAGTKQQHTSVSPPVITEESRMHVFHPFRRADGTAYWPTSQEMYKIQ